MSEIFKNEIKVDKDEKKENENWKKKNNFFFNVATLGMQRPGLLVDLIVDQGKNLFDLVDKIIEWTMNDNKGYSLILCLYMFKNFWEINMYIR